jgi:peptidyl serine alpha-galactosyltransferase
MLAPPPAARVHTVFCAECTEEYDYKSLGVFHSHNLSGMPGGVTRLLACDKEELKTYRGLHIGPTFVHQNHKRIWHTRALGPGETDHPFGAARNDSSGSYNKPGSIMHWVREAPEAKGVEYVLYIDADMLLRKPMDPIAMGVRRGVVVSEHVGYLDVGLLPHTLTLTPSTSTWASYPIP